MAKGEKKHLFGYFLVHFNSFLQQTLQKTVIMYHRITVDYLIFLNSEEMHLLGSNINLHCLIYTMEPLDPVKVKVIQ